MKKRFFVGSDRKVVVESDTCDGNVIPGWVHITIENCSATPKEARRVAQAILDCADAAEEDQNE